MAENKTQRSFVLYTEYAQHVSRLSDREAGALFKAILAFVESGTKPQLTGKTDMAFSFISMQLVRDMEKYEETREKRRACGKLGGRPRSAPATGNEIKPDIASGNIDVQKANGFSEKQNSAKKPDNVDGDVYVNDDVDVDSDVNAAAEVSSAPNFVSGTVTLTQQQHKQLTTEFGEAKVAEYIRRCDEYQKRKGRTYPNNCDIIRQWLIRDKDVSKDPDGFDADKYSIFINQF